MLSNNNYQLSTPTSEIAGDMPRDVWWVTAKFINTFQATHRFRATCKLFHQLDNEEETYRALLQKFFPDVYAKLCSDGFKNGWKELYIGTILKYCIDLTPAQLDDYSHIRRCDPVEIARILEQPNGLERILISDMCDMTLWDYLRHPVHDQHRQTILDLIYAELLARFFKHDTDDVARLYTRHIDSMIKIYGNLANEFSEPALPAQLVFAVACHQKGCLSHLIPKGGDLPLILKNYLMLVALYHNNLDVFIQLSADSQIKDDNGFWATIVKSLPGIIKHHVLSQPLADALFNKIQERLKFGFEFDWFGFNLFQLAAVLNQVTFFQGMHATYKTKKYLLDQSPLELSTQHDGVELYNLLFGLGERGGYSQENIFRYISKSNNLLLLKQMLAQNNLNFLDLQEILTFFCDYGDLNSVNVMLSKNTEITSNVLRRTLESFNKSSNPHIFRAFVNKLGKDKMAGLLKETRHFKIHSPTLIRWLQTEFEYEFSQSISADVCSLTKEILENIMLNLYSEQSMRIAEALLNAGATINWIREFRLGEYLFIGTALQLLIDTIAGLYNVHGTFRKELTLKNGVRLFKLMLEHGADVDNLRSGYKKTARDMINELKDEMIREKLLTIIAEVKNEARNDVPKPGLRLS